ncbi:MAG: tRNA (adenosine(37)-N6)-threonylcarbamoyltransferase complex dimerization subunit type 1 TsaB [Acidobacteriaceae bacterium]|nr:tRNA (adenosine(37)-N6)-threonylcarbamoyltransferase complex dimerization subunit type 1 TsaB [Acidobacteriaceae bacterium]
MTILAFDFTSEHGSLAVRRHGETLIEQGLHSTDGFSHLVFLAIDELLRQTGIRLGEIDCFASASGPGAFTGVRVGLSAVKGLAEALSKKAIGVSNLRAVASFGNLPSRAVVLDARRGDVFTAVYDASLNPIIPEAVGKLDAFLRNLPGRPDQFLTPGVDWLRAALETTPLAYIPVIEVSRGLASAVAQCAERDLHRGVTGNPAALDANYVRRSDAELFWKDV